MQSNAAGASFGPRKRLGAKLLDRSRGFVIPSRTPMTMTTSTAMMTLNSNANTNVPNATSMMSSCSSSTTNATRVAYDAMENVNTNASTMTNTNASKMASVKSMMANSTRLLPTNDTSPLLLVMNCYFHQVNCYYLCRLLTFFSITTWPCPPRHDEPKCPHFLLVSQLQRAKSIQRRRT